MRVREREREREKERERRERERKRERCDVIGKSSASVFVYNNANRQLPNWISKSRSRETIPSACN